MKKWDIALTAILVACALITTGLVIRREFFAPNVVATAAEKPRYIDDWRTHLSDGVLVGSPQAPVQIIEFADFECPFCANFHNTLKSVEAQYPGKVAVSFVHFPLPGHRFAESAARAAECAADQGHFQSMQDQLFGKQDSFGLKPWSDFAALAGVPDLQAFDTCAKQEAPVQRVELGKKVGEQLDVRSTPTIIINGWKLVQPPSETELQKMIAAILAGKNPVD